MRRSNGDRGVGYRDGRGEIELAGGRRIPLEPGSVILAEDSTGKGHISRTLGTEDRIALNIQLADR